MLLHHNRTHHNSDDRGDASAAVSSDVPRSHRSASALRSQGLVTSLQVLNEVEEGADRLVVEEFVSG